MSEFAEQEPLIYLDVRYYQCAEKQEDGGFRKIAHEEIEGIADPDVRRVLGEFSTRGQTENGWFATPIINADGTLRRITSVPYGRRHA